MTMAVNRRVVVAAIAFAVAALAFVAALVGASGPGAAQASSHREAPVISDDPAADNTDVYAFVSPDRPDSVTMIANYIPLEEPAGGPNFAKFADSVLYAIHVDNDGDGEEDITYEFRFKTQVLNGNTFLYNDGPITSLDDPNWNVRQTYSVTRVMHGPPRREEVLGENLPTPPVNIGPRSTPNYDALASAAVANLGEIKTFAGQRDDPFFVDLGSVFDLAGLRPFNTFHIIPLATEDGVDGVAGFNTHTIAIQVPTSQLVATGPTIGVYASASRRKVTIIREDGTRDSDGPWVQVSRLAEPLINEVVIGLGQKDRWNGSEPEDDAQFVARYTDPEVTVLENALYPALDNAPETGRGDLVAILLTGVPTLNFTGPVKADLIRLNTAIAPSGPAGAGNRLGLLAGDFAGFPNGRRLEDDVTDIELRAFACGYGPIVGPIIEGFGFCKRADEAAPNANRAPNNLLGDGVDENEKSFMTTFPYVATPHQGYEHGHHGA